MTSKSKTDNTRRTLLKTLGGVAVTGLTGLRPTISLAQAKAAAQKAIPAIGMGTWLTFNTAPLTAARKKRVDVLREFFSTGGTLVDSSPMYGFAEATIGHCLKALDNDQHLYSATKVWTRTEKAGINQMNHSMKLWGLDSFDLMQIHNMVDWETHLKTLRKWKEGGKVKNIGITTSHGRRHESMLNVIQTQPDFDFVQFTYNIEDREAEKRLLPAAAEHGKKVIINRPFKGGTLFSQVRDRPLPPWAEEIDCQNWAQFFLKFIISHPAVTVAIPATSRVDHMQENMGALHGKLPDARMRKRMADYFSGT